MNRLKVLVAAALLGLPLAACEEGTTPPPVGEIDGQVVIEGEGMDGIAVTLSSGAATTTSNGGYYQFSDVEGGTYTVTISGVPEDASFDATSAEVTITTSGQSVTRNFSGSYIRTASLMGMVTVEGMGLEGVMVTISGRQDAQMLTDANGQYTFTGLRAGNYTAEISGFDPTDVGFSNTSSAVTVAVGESKVWSFDGTYVRESTIMGQVSVEGNGLGDVTVSLQGMGAETEAMTDDGGQYTFGELRAGEYQVAISGFDASEYGFTTTSATVQVQHGQTANIPFEGILLRTASIMGQVSVEGEGLGDVTVSLSGEGENRTMMTDESGQYTFTDLPAGNFAVGISGYDTDDYSFEATSKNVALALGATATVPFEGILLRTSGISGRVSVEGTGLDSVTVTLSGDDLDEDMTSMTDATGQYAIAGLAEGDYTVAISGHDDVAYIFETTSMDVTLGDDDTQIVNFMGAHARTGSISGMVYVDEAAKNDSYDEGEHALAVPGIALALVGPDGGILAPTVGATNADGMFAFTGLRSGAYQLVVSPVNPAIPQDYAYGGSASGYQFVLGVGGEETQNIPFDITHQTVNFSVTLKSGDATGDALPGATVTLYSDLAGEQRVGTGESDEMGMASIRFARAVTAGNQVYAAVSSDDYHASGGVQAVMWDAKYPMAAASNDGDIVNLKADFSFSGATITTEFGGGKALGGWAISVSSDKSAAADTPAKLGADGSAKYSEVVVADSLPVTYTVALAANQANTLDGGSKYKGTKLEHTHDGLSLAATMDAGMIEANYTTQTLKVYVHHERDQVMGYTGNVLGGDARVSGMIDIDIRYIERASGRSRAFPTSPSAVRVREAESNGVITFTNVPADAQVIVTADEDADADGIKLLDQNGHSDELAAYTNRGANGIMGGAFGDNGGYHHTVELCPLMRTDPTGQRFGECGSFAYISTYAVHGQVWKKAVYPATSGDGFTTHDQLHVPGTSITMNPVDGENLAGDPESYTAAAADNRLTRTLDERKQFNWGQKAAGVYKVSVTAGWTARRGTPAAATNDLAAHIDPLGGDLQIDVTPTTGFVYGRVVGEDGFAVDSVSVSVNGVSAMTDEFGRYSAEGFGAATRRIGSTTHRNKIFVETSQAGHDDTRTIIDFAANTPQRVDIILEGAAKTATVSGTVTASGTGATVAGARIWVDYGDGPVNPQGVSASRGLVTGANGTYTATVVAQAAGSTVAISATKSDMSFTPASYDVSAVEGSAISGINFAGFRKATVTGRVSTGGRPMDSVTVVANQVGGTATDTATTGVTGTYSLFVPFGNYDVTASKAGFTFDPATQRVNVGPGENKSIDDFAAVVIPSDDATLSDLTLSNDVNLTPTFADSVTTYSASAPHTVEQITVTATTTNQGADAVITPADADATAAGHQVNLGVGINEIEVTVTAADGTTTEEYTVTVTRREPAAQDDDDLATLSVTGGELDPAFESDVHNYSVEVARDVGQVTVSAGANHAEATLAIVPADADANMAGHQVDLEPSSTTITVTVTAADGTSMQDYIITVNRGADVPSAPQQLTVSSPSSGTLLVGWRAPANEGAKGITEYQYRVGAGGDWTQAPQGTFGNFALVRSVSPSTPNGLPTTVYVRAASIDTNVSPNDTTLGAAAHITGSAWAAIETVSHLPETIDEGDTTTVTVALDAAVFYATRVELTAKRGSIVGPGVITYLPGEQSKTFKVVADDNATDDAGESTADTVTAKVAETEASGRTVIEAHTTVITVTDDDHAPSQVQTLVATAGDGMATVTWDSLPDFDADNPSPAGKGTGAGFKYQIRYKITSADAEGDWVDVGTVLTFDLTSLENGVPYTVDVRAVSDAGAGEPAEVNVTPTAAGSG